MSNYLIKLFIDIIPLVFKNPFSLYIKILLFLKKIRLLIAVRILSIIAINILVYVFTKNILIVIGVLIVTIIIILIRELIFRKNRGLIFFCGYFLLDEKDNLKISKNSNSINAGIYDYIYKNIKSYEEIEVFKDFLKDFKRVNILRFASGLNLDEFKNYLEIKFKRSFPIKIIYGYIREDNIFSKFLFFDENSQKIEDTTLDKYFSLYPKYVKQISDYYAIGELIALFHLFNLFISTSFTIFDIGDKFNSIKILNELDYFLKRERNYFNEKLGILEYVNNQFDLYEHIVHEQKSYYQFQVNSDYENSAKEIEKSLLYRLHSHNNDDEFINYLTISYCNVISKSSKALELGNYEKIDELSESDIKAALMFLSYNLTIEIKDYSMIINIFDKLLNKYKENKIIYYFYGLSYYTKSIQEKNYNMLKSGQKYFKKALDLDTKFLLAKNKLFWSKIAYKSDFFGQNFPEIMKENMEGQCKLLIEFEDFFLLIGDKIRTSKQN